MSDPAEASEEALDQLAGLTSKVGENLQQAIKGAAADESRKLGKEPKITYSVGTPSSNVKEDIVKACQNMKADMLVIGPGVDGTGSLPSCIAMNAQNFTVCVVRDHVE